MITFDRAINRLAERVADRTLESRRNQLQRRNQVVDVYGMEFTRQGDVSSPATFYLSISPDLIYYERFEFKIIIESFAIPVASDGINPATVQVRDRSLAVNDVSLSIGGTSLSIGANNQITANPHGHSITPNPHGHSITPNPHDHLTEPHSHQVTAGMSFAASNASNFTIWIEGVNLTPFLRAQFPDRWVDGEGVFPRSDLSNYDVLEAAGYMSSTQRDLVLSPGYKKVEIWGDGIFKATLVNYLKYSHVNR